MQLPQLLSLDAYLANETALRDQLRAGCYTSPIPLLNHAQLQELPDNTLVRFRGMIQDMLDPEIYLERYEVFADAAGRPTRVQDGRYRDVLVRQSDETVDFNNANNVNGERRSLFLVSVPGLNDWATNVERERYHVDSLFPNAGRIGNGNAGKRPLEDDDDAMDTDTGKVCATKKAPSGAGDASAQQAGSAAAAAASPPSAPLLSAQYLVNSPIPDRPGKACLAKVYENIDDFTLNSIVEVVGFLSVNPVLDASTHAADDEEESTGFDEAAEIQANNPPPSLVPRVHCVLVRPLQHLNPLLADDGKADDDVRDSEAANAFDDVLLALTQCLFGDALAAEYLMCHLISTVYIRSDLQHIGQFSLNLSNIPGAVLPWYTKELYAVLESLLPASHLLPLTLENLNTAQFEPKKDYKTNKLTSGLLQLAPHTHLVLDETRLLAGRLEAAGVTAVQTIAQLITQQQLKADFQFYQLNYNADVPVLCLSEGKSMLPTNCLVRLQPADDAAVAQIRETLAAAAHFLQQPAAKVQAIRRRLTQAKLVDFEMGVECLETIQTDFVQMRRDDKQAGADDLHALLVLSRLLGICRGDGALSAEMWQKAKRMEAQRRARLSV